MKKYGRFCSVLLIQAMALSVFPASVYAEEESGSLFVGGVEVTAENAADILGDGTVSYDMDTNTLVLNNAEITYGYEEELFCAIYSEDYLTIELNGTNKIELEDNDSSSFGIYVEDGLSVYGVGELDISAGDITAGTADGSALMSVGIFTMGCLDIAEASIHASGGALQLSAESEETMTCGYSCGVYTLGGMSLDFGGSLSAVADQVTAGMALSFGILGNNENISIYEGTLEAVGGDTAAQSYSSSAGICTADCGFYVYDKSANVSLTSGKVEGETARSNGIYLDGGDFCVDAGNVHIVGGTGDGDGTAVHVEGYVDEDGYDRAGTVSIGTFSMDEDMADTQVILEASNGAAIYAENGIDTNETMMMTEPEHAKAEGKGEMNEETYLWDYYTVVDADGKAASKVIWSKALEN